MLTGLECHLQSSDFSVWIWFYSYSETVEHFILHSYIVLIMTEKNCS